jgi:coenzyme F420 hydrogenase subunit beta
MKQLNSVIDVAAWRLCIGCGACAYACPEQKIQLIDVENRGIRPVRAVGNCGSCSVCVSVCPGVDVPRQEQTHGQGELDELAASWGPLLEIWEGFAADAAVRRDGSSGGLSTALAMFCVERLGMAGVLHIGNDDQVGYRSKSQFSKSRVELLAATGSRYAPASPCERLDLIENATAPCVFLGKPCDVEALRKAADLREHLREKIGVAIGIFCAGTPSTAGTLDLMRSHGIAPEDVEEVRYRGRGWPGTFAVRLRSESNWRDLATYAEAWGFLQRYRPFRCHLCPDGTSEFADISCGDPWYRDIDPGEPGMSLVLVRTERGRRIVQGAIEAGYITLRRVPAEVLALSQAELQKKRGAIWGRVLTMRAMGVPTPRLRGFHLFRNWRALSLSGKVRSFSGTIKRILARSYYVRDDYVSGRPADPPR